MITNLTRHPVVICDQAGVPRLTLEPPLTASELARVKEDTILDNLIKLPNGLDVPVYAIRYSKPDISNLIPAPQPDTYYIVPRLVADMFRDRADLLYPYELVRAENKTIEGCKSLARFDHTCR